MEAILKVDHLTKKYKNFTLEDVSFEVPRGMIYGLVGENGAGKTTTISAILNMIEIDGGTVELFGDDHIRSERALKQRIGVIIDGMYPFEGYYVKDIHRIMNAAYSHWDKARFFELLDKFELPMDKKIKDLSKGMAVKLNFAVALAHNAELLILDEATSGLDPVMRDEILTLLQEFVLDERCSVLLSTHITSDLDKIADCIIFMHQGRIIFARSKDELDVDYGIVHCGRDLFEALAPEDVVAWIKEDYEYKVLVCHKSRLRECIHDLPMDKATIEDIMLFYIRGQRK